MSRDIGLEELTEVADCMLRVRIVLLSWGYCRTVRFAKINDFVVMELREVCVVDGVLARRYLIEFE